MLAKTAFLIVGGDLRNTGATLERVENVKPLETDFATLLAEACG
jgi:hypothetical protein